jgi:pimeloyl-ACP methyl ester carboxylesterase
MRDRPSRERVLGELVCPVLVVVGEKDVMTTTAEARSMVHLCRDARLAVLPGVGHLANMEAPALFNGALAEFLRGL